MFRSLCSFPLQTDVFSLSSHPSEPLIALGLTSGHVQIERIPPVDGQNEEDDEEEDEDDGASRSTTSSLPIITRQWRTRRHKGSCRSLCFDVTGYHVISCGSDGIVKIAETETGVVVGKIATPALERGGLDVPCLVRGLNRGTILLATDSGALYVYDLRSLTGSSTRATSNGKRKSESDGSTASARPAQTYHPHDDYITSLCPLPASASTSTSTSTSTPTVKQWLSTGGSTVSVTDLRRGVITQSEDQAEELLSSAIVGGHRALVGGDSGTMKEWKMGVWDNSEKTIRLGDKAQTGSVEVLAEVPGEDAVAAGMDDGRIKFVRWGKGKAGQRGQVVEKETVIHDEMEGVTSLAFVQDGDTMVSAGGPTVQIWRRSRAEDLEGVDNEDEDGVLVNGRIVGNRSDLDDDGDDDDDRDDSSEDEAPKRKKKKRRKKNKSGGGGAAAAGKTFNFKGLD